VIAGASCLLALSCGRAAGPEPIRVAAAISLSGPLEEAVAPFEARTGRRVAVSTAASNTLAQQLIEGARADLFISADERQMRRVAGAGLVDGPVVPLLGNRLVVIVPAGTSLGRPMPGALIGADVRHLAIGDPAGVPAGVYARKWLTRERLWRELEGRIVPAGSVRAALAAVASGNAEAGIVYATDALGHAGVTIAYEIAGESAPRIVYPAAVLTRAGSPGAARKLLIYLKDDAHARAVFARAGFVLPDADATP
jgi:molybdate transport system substrate-binding protein